MKIDLEELGLAYRRVKADLYYTRHANSAKIIRFEKALAENLERLHSYLVTDEVAPLYAYCYGWRLVPKSSFSFTLATVYQIWIPNVLRCV